MFNANHPPKEKSTMTKKHSRDISNTAVVRTAGKRNVPPIEPHITSAEDLTTGKKHAYRMLIEVEEERQLDVEADDREEVNHEDGAGAVEE